MCLNGLTCGDRYLKLNKTYSKIKLFLLSPFSVFSQQRSTSSSSMKSSGTKVSQTILIAFTYSALSKLRSKTESIGLPDLCYSVRLKENRIMLPFIFLYAYTSPNSIPYANWDVSVMSMVIKVELSL